MSLKQKVLKKFSIAFEHRKAKDFSPAQVIRECFIFLPFYICVAHDRIIKNRNLWRKVRAYENIIIQWRTTQREYMEADYGCKEVYP